MAKIFLFNPGSEAALSVPRFGTYTPPALVRRMSADLSPMCRYLINDGDALWSPYAEGSPLIAPAYDTADPQIICSRSIVPPLCLSTWGYAPACHRVWHKMAMGRGLHLSRLPDYSPELCSLADRSVSVRILEDLVGRGFDIDSSLLPRWLYSASDLQDYLTQHSDKPLLVKLPASSSGRGLLRLSTGRPETDLVAIRKALRSYGRISIEPFLKRESDWAMEFESDGRGAVRLCGYSHFYTTDGGKYLGNRLASQAQLRLDFAKRMGGEIAAVETLEKHLAEVLSQLYGHCYEGPLGVDMLFYEGEPGVLRLHPCVEVNVRYTMGFLAMHLADRLMSAQSHEGVFRIVSARSSELLRQQEDNCRRDDPLRIDSDGRIVSGHFGLTPIASDSRFSAYVQICP